MRIVEPDLYARDWQTTTNIDKDKAVLVEAPRRCRTRSTQCSITALLAGKKEKKNNSSFLCDKPNVYVFIFYFQVTVPLYEFYFIGCVYYVCFAPPSSIESGPSFSSAYMQQNAVIFCAISYKLKLYADFVFNSEEEHR